MWNKNFVKKGYWYNLSFQNALLNFDCLLKKKKFREDIMGIFTKSVIIGLIASIVLTSIARLISVYFKTKKNLANNQVANVFNKNQKMKINFIRNL